MAVLLLILANAFFVAAEFALVAVDRDRVEHLAGGGSRRARSALAALRRLSFHLSGAQLGITVTSLVLGFIAEDAIATLIEPTVDRLPLVTGNSALGISIALALGVATFAQMLLGELVPKNIAIARPMGAVLLLATPIRVYGTLLAPVIAFLNAAANWLSRRVGVEPQEELTAVRSIDELELLVRSSAERGTLEPEAVTLLRRTFRFGDKTADEAMVPRVDVVALPAGATVADLARVAVETGSTRFPVHGGDLDDVLGVAVANDVLAVPPEQRGTTPVTALMHPVLAVPESRDLGSLLLEMRSGGVRMAVVVDEYGGTAGIVTLEDLLEEIVGDIEDEYDASPPTRLTAPVAPGTHVVEGSLHRDELWEATGLEIPDGDYETLAGFVLAALGHIPAVGEQVEHAGWVLEILQLDGRRIALVAVTPPADRPDESGEAGEGDRHT